MPDDVLDAPGGLHSCPLCYMIPKADDDEDEEWEAGVGTLFYIISPPFAMVK